MSASYQNQLLYVEYDISNTNCGGASLPLCFRWNDPLDKITVPEELKDYVYQDIPKTVEQVHLEQVQNSIQSQIDEVINTRLAAYRQAYAQTCASPDKLQDKLTIEYSTGLHHYTLYYYDRAGRLQRTVPPEGVELLPANKESEVIASRTAATRHRLVTSYKYNSLGQLVEQQTPDAGKTTFYYNSVGQLRFSQNAKQVATGAYSYTKYDALGRVVEVGESTLAGFATQANDPNFPTTNTTHITRTVYSKAHTNDGKAKSEAGAAIAYLDGSGQKHLTNRVSYTYTDVDGSETTLADRSFTYYSYDAHGNVAWLAQELPGLGRKFIAYDYDLLSGKVLRVRYQEGRPDQFFHRYDYDADNRITAVYTSTDGQLWDRDAAYQYYAHGPLKRMELGEDRVQGLDYTYTLQGWLKGINHPLVNNIDLDPSKDGAVGKSQVGRDAFGMQLGYYKDDFIRNGHSLTAASMTAHSPLAEQSLYNGNIAGWSAGQFYRDVSKVAKSDVALERFRYDELNRLKGSDFQSLSGGPSGNAFKTAYSYDANGNLKRLHRYDAAGKLLDKLHYVYSEDASKKLLHNKLGYVLDSAGTTASLTDLEPGQLAGNYSYDAVGNLTGDVQSQIRKISWSPYGKALEIEKNTGQKISFGYDASGNRILKKQGSRTTFYVRDASGNIMANYTLAPPVNSTTPELRLAEQPIYGSSRVGVRQPNLLLSSTTEQVLRVQQDQSFAQYPGQSVEADMGVSVTLTNGFAFTASAGKSFSVSFTQASGVYTRQLARKSYELVDHLGNARAVVSDKKLRQSDGSYEPDVRQATAYYAFGQEQEGRFVGLGVQPESYRYGYNGKEKDQQGEWGLTSYDYGFRIYNPAIGKFLSVDPLTKDYPFYTPYQFAGNKPIMFVDVDGLEEGYNIRFEQMQRGYLKGKVSAKQLREFHTDAWREAPVARNAPQSEPRKWDIPAHAGGPTAQPARQNQLNATHSCISYFYKME